MDSVTLLGLLGSLFVLVGTLGALVSLSMTLTLATTLTLGLILAIMGVVCGAGIAGTESGVTAYW